MFSTFTNTPRSSLLLTYSRSYLPIHILSCESLLKDTWVRKQAASSAGTLKSNRTEQTLMMLSSDAVDMKTGLEYQT